MYFATVVWDTSIPSLSSSPCRRGAPQSGFAKLIFRISSRTSKHDRRPSRFMPTLPSPIPAESSSLPSDNRFALHQEQRRAPIRPEARKPNPEQSVCRIQTEAPIRNRAYETLYQVGLSQFMSSGSNQAPHSTHDALGIGPVKSLHGRGERNGDIGDATRFTGAVR